MLTVIKSTRHMQYGALWLRDETYTYAYDPCHSAITRWEGEFEKHSSTISHYKLKWYNLTDDQVMDIIKDWDNIKKERDDARQFRL